MICIISGYFNPLHLGHLEYLEAAYDYCWNMDDESALGLLVIVNNDNQVKLKDSIPFLPEKTRAKIVENFKLVHDVYVAIDEDHSVCKTLAKIAQEYETTKTYRVFEKPLYFINSGDRQHATPKEHDTCKQHGITEVFLDLPKINSSSKILDAVGKEYINRTCTRMGPNTVIED